MMAFSEDHIALAAEYALGTLDADERAQVETMMSIDTDFIAVVHAWEYRLGVLNQMVGSVEPRPEVWERIRAAIGHSGRRSRWCCRRRRRYRPRVRRVRSCARRPFARHENSSVIRLAIQLRRWRNIATFTTAIAAALVAMIAVGIYQPDLLAEGIRPKPRTQVVEVKTPPTPPAPPSAHSMLPCCRRTADRRRSFSRSTVRPGISRFARSAPSPNRAGVMNSGSCRTNCSGPRSLGVIGGNNFTARPVLSAYAPELVEQATYAVTVEPEGGSPTGIATGPIVFTGKLIESVPPAAPAPSRAR